MPSPSVLIVGAGPVGLTTALALHQGGVPASDILVADQRPSRQLTQTWSKALSTSASSVEVFRILGITERILGAGMPAHKMHFGAGSKFLDLNYDVLGAKYPFNMVIPQGDLEVILLQLCEEAGIAFSWGRQFTGLTQTAEEVSATFRLGEGEETETIKASWLVGCDGTGSAVRQAAGIAFDGTKATRYGWLADAHADEDAPTAKTILDLGGKAMCFATGSVKTKRRFVGFYHPSEHAGGQRPSPPDIDYLRNWAARNFGSHFNIRDVTWTSVVGDGMRIAASFRAGRVFVAGDAAHQLFPAGGQGMNTGLLDATNLAWKLGMLATGKIGGDHEVVERVLDSYGEERRPAAKAVMQNVHMQLVSLFATTERDKAVSEFMTEALAEPALNALWARRVSGFADPVEPYQLAYAGLGQGEELVGTRLTHISDVNEDDILEAAKHNTLVVGFMAGSVFAEEQRNSLEQAVQLGGHSDKVRILATLLKPDNPKWKGIAAVLIRPDLRVAWVAREGSDIKATQEGFTRVVEWWFGGK